MTGISSDTVTVVAGPDAGARGRVVLIAVVIAAIAALTAAGFAIFWWQGERRATETERVRLETEQRPAVEQLASVRRETEELDRRRILLLVDASPQARAALADVETDLLNRMCELESTGDAIAVVGAATATADSAHPELAAITPEWRSGLDLEAVRQALGRCETSR